MSLFSASGFSAWPVQRRPYDHAGILWPLHPGGYRVRRDQKGQHGPSEAACWDQFCAAIDARSVASTPGVTSASERKIACPRGTLTKVNGTPLRLIASSTN